MHFARPLAPVALAASLLLAACGDDPAPSEAPVDEVPAMPLPAEPEPAPLPVEPVNSAATAPAPVIEPDRQVLDDADATGMTARVDRSGDLPPDEDGQPANAQ